MSFNIRYISSGLRCPAFPRISAFNISYGSSPVTPYSSLILADDLISFKSLTNCVDILLIEDLNVFNACLIGPDLVIILGSTSLSP